MPSRYEGLISRREATGVVRSTAFAPRLPQKPKGVSFFVRQTAEKAGGA